MHYQMVLTAFESIFKTIGCWSSKRLDSSEETRIAYVISNAEKGFPNPSAHQLSPDSSVVGRTGSGLSQVIFYDYHLLWRNLALTEPVQFIHDVTGEYEVGVATGAGLRPFTQKITPISTHIKELYRTGKVVLIDTPGFDFSRGNTEHDIFDELAEWTKRKYGRMSKLDGVIYMHNIWNEELYHRSPLLTSDALEEMCGPEWREKVVFVNSHWNERLGDNASERETRLRDRYWSFMLVKGSPMIRYEEPKRHERAVEILKLIVTGP